ncbi:MAG: preprotein translocase subunit SecE [Bacteroidia bacterium]|nr:preprotein translocase subunit SecE [Bacteroidia bacterium]MCX7652267.1 preprotein translocase subunit SecE [Bacteroidia bacterium]MDW8416529.1 preprotein translocase subunit SecE [Bacteroidia bacterium]
MREKLTKLWKDYSLEWRTKVEWPALPQLFSTTVAVLVGSLLLAIVIGLIDLIFSTVMRGLYSIF